MSQELEATLARGIDLPLAALRASLESLNQSLPGDDPLGGVIQGFLRLGTNVRELVEFTCPPVPQPTGCSASEVTQNALRGLSQDHRERVILARVELSTKLYTDAPLLAKSLRRVIENALEATSEPILLTVRQQGDETLFCVVDGATRTFDTGDPIVPFHSTKRNHLGLGLVLTQRDIGLVGGSMRLDRTRLGDTCVFVTVPNRFAPQVAA